MFSRKLKASVLKIWHLDDESWNHPLLRNGQITKLNCKSGVSRTDCTVSTTCRCKATA